MAQNINATSMQAMLKRLQPQKDVEKLWQQMYPGIATVRKADDFEGTQIDCPLEYDHPAVSSAFASAQGNRYPSSSVKYNITRTRLYGVGRVDMELAKSARSDKGSWVRAIAREQSNVLLAMRKTTARWFYRNHGGAIGQVAAIANGDGTNDRLTLTRKSDVWNFSRGMELNADTTDGSAGGAVNAGDVTVRKIDFANGYVYVGSDVNTPVDYTTEITGGAVNDFLFPEGDFGQAFRGLESWIPLVAPVSGENFLGIDRSVSPERLAGHRINDTSLTREEMVQELAARISYTGGNDLRAYMAPIQLKQFALELDTKVTRDPGGKGRVGFSGVAVDTASGTVEVLADPACPEDRMYMIDPSTFMVHHLEAFPHLVTDDGLSSARVADADEIEFRYRLWGNMGCTAPGKNGVAALPAAL